MPETLMSDLNRLRWRSRRGMRELDLLFLAYLDQRYPQADADERAAFERTLDLTDPQLFDYLLGRGRPDDPAIADVIDHLAASLKT